MPLVEGIGTAKVHLPLNGWLVCSRLASGWMEATLVSWKLYIRGHWVKFPLHAGTPGTQQEV